MLFQVESEELLIHLKHTIMKWTIETCYKAILVKLADMTEAFDNGYPIDATVYYSSAKRLMDIYVTLEDSKQFNIGDTIK